MLRTNTKKYLANIESHILDSIPQDGTPEEKLNFVFDAYEIEHNYEYNKRRTPNHQERFSDWLQGLPSAISIEWSSAGIIELAKELQEMREEYPPKLEARIIANYYSFIALHVMKLRDKYPRPTHEEFDETGGNVSHFEFNEEGNNVIR